MGCLRLRKIGVAGTVLALVPLGVAERHAVADPIYTITNLGTLPGTTQSIATGINASGQVTGVSYTTSDGTWKAVGRLGMTGISYDTGAKSFLYSGSQMTQINPVGGPANAINDSGQVVGGHYSSINDAGQYVGSSWGGEAYNGQYSFPSQLVTGGVVSAPPIVPSAINNAGQIGGALLVWNVDYHAAIVQNGHVTDLSAQLGLNGLSDNVNALSNSGYAIIGEAFANGPAHYLLYDPTGYHFNGTTGPSLTDLTELTGGSGKYALGLNDLGQVVGNGFLYNGGKLLALQDLLPAPSSAQWSNLVATAINDSGQIVGQGMIDGKEQAFEMTPITASTPEPSAILIFSLIAGAAGIRHLAKRSRRPQGG